MKVSLKTVTPNAETTIVEIARVSSSRTDKTEKPEGLINYLIKHKHWSPFEHGYMTIEVETSRAIGRQLLRHRSFTFQEFSQRYQDVRILTEEEWMFEQVELRRKGLTNRQSSEEVFDPIIKTEFSNHPNLYRHASAEIKMLFEMISRIYGKLLDAGVSNETARNILPEATKTRLYLTGPVRSWIHFLSERTAPGAQKEVREIALLAKDIFKEQFPIVSRALWEGDKPVTLKDLKGIVDEHVEVMQEVKKTSKRLSKTERAAVKKDRERMTVKEVAIKYNISKRTVARITNENK